MNIMRKLHCTQYTVKYTVIRNLQSATLYTVHSAVHCNQEAIVGYTVDSTL